MSRARAELVLYHGIANTGTIEWSTASNTGPWTTSTLTSSLPVLDALDAWATAIGTAATRTITWTWTATGNGTLTLGVSGGNLWLKLTLTLQELLGFSTQVIANGSTGTLGLGIGMFAVGRTEPWEGETGELEEFRGGRASAYQHGRATEVEIEIGCTATQWASIEGSPLISGHGARKLVWTNEDDYAEADLDGAIIAYPRQTVDVQHTDPNGYVYQRHACTMADPGDTISGVQASDTQYATLMGGVRFGYAPQYLLVIEGISTIPLEWAGDAIAPTDYTLDASLVIDESARVGPVISPTTHFSAGLDLQVRLLATTAIDAIMTRPTKTTTLTADITATDTAIPAVSTLGWGSSNLHIGTSCEEFVGALLDEFTVTRGTFGRQRAYKSGALVADKPYIWRGRRATLYMALLDPTGRYVQGADILSDACVLWDGYVQERPYRDRNEWVVPCRDQVRRLTQPLGVAASGKALWNLLDDTLLAVDPSAVLTLRITDEGGGTYTDEDYTIRPFSSLSSPAYHSQMRQAIVDAVDSVRGVTGSGWRLIEGGTPNRIWQFFVPVTLPDADNRLRAEVALEGGGNTPYVFAQMWAGEMYLTGPADTVNFDTALVMKTLVVGAGLSVELDDVAPAELPSAGFVQIERDGSSSYARYTSLTTDTANAQLVRLGLDDGSVTADELAAIIAGTDPAEVSVKFYWLDSGRLRDILRRAIVSTGDAQHGAYDTLPRGQGLGLPNIDTDSFDEVFDGFFRDLSLVIASESGTSLEELTSGLLRLSSRGLTARRAKDGTAVNIAAVHVGTPSGVPVETITDDLLVSSGGRRPVRVREVYAAPQAIEVTCRTLPIGDVAEGEGKILLRDEHLTDWSGVRWELDVYGVDRSALVDAAKVWATSWFRGGENRQVLEVDVPAWLDVQPGDVVSLDLSDPHLWNYATGAAGLTGLARCLGAQLGLTSGVLTLTLSVDGILASGPMAPSIPISAVNGGATTPTSIDIDDAYYDLLVYAKNGEASWKVLAYQPGHDGGRAEYTVSTVGAPSGGLTRLTVTAYPSGPSVSLTTGWRLTWPEVADCTDTQDLYLHNTDKTQWA